MSQPRNRRPSMTREPPRKAPADYAFNNVKENRCTKDTIKIPRNVRYELENALLGLCDVWFEEIKPHLVKNNLKLHTGGALNEGGYSDLEPAKEPRRDGRRQLDPGADTRRRPARAANLGACSPPQPAALKAQSPKPPSRTYPTSPTNLRKLLQLPDDAIKRPPGRTANTAPPIPQSTENLQRNVKVSSKQQCQPPPFQKAPVQRSPLTQTIRRNVPNATNRIERQRGPSTEHQLLPQPKIHKSSKQPIVQKAPPQRSTLPNAQTAKSWHPMNNHYPTERDNMWTQPPSRRVPTQAPAQSTTQFYQQNGHKEQFASSKRKKRKSVWTRGSTRQIPLPSNPPPRRVARPCCTACALARVQNDNIPKQSRVARPCTKITPQKTLTTNKDANSSHWPAPKFPQISVATQDRAILTDLPVCAPSFSPAGDVQPSLHVVAGNSSSMQSHSKSPSQNPIHHHVSMATCPSRSKKKSPFSLHNSCALPSQLHAKCLSPPHPMVQSPKNQPVSTTLPPAPSSDEMWCLRVLEEYTRSKEGKNPPIREYTKPGHDTKSSRHTIPFHNENQLLLEDNGPLFSKDLVDLIGYKNDQRLTVLYENPNRQESQPSVMCLAGSRKKRIKSTPKKMPWR